MANRKTIRRRRVVDGDVREKIKSIAIIIDDMDLGSKEKKLLAVLLLPDSVDMPVSQIVEIAGCSVNYYYNRLHNEKFQAAQKKWAEIFYKSQVCRFLNRYMDLALNSIDVMGNKGNRQALERLLEHIGIFNRLNPETRVEVYNFVRSDTDQLKSRARDVAGILSRISRDN